MIGISVIACGQDEILGPGTCLWCEDSLPRAGGVLTKAGRMCSEDCAADWTEHQGQQRAATHLHQRDLLCECDTCTAAGHPTAAERAEYAAYQAGREQ